MSGQCNRQALRAALVPVSACFLSFKSACINRVLGEGVCTCTTPTPWPGSLLRFDFSEAALKPLAARAFFPAGLTFQARGPFTFRCRAIFFS